MKKFSQGVQTKKKLYYLQSEIASEVMSAVSIHYANTEQVVSFHPLKANFKQTLHAAVTRLGK